MIAKIYSALPQGFSGKLVEVEGDSNRGLPAFNIVGMAAKTVSEARERVRAAITNSGFQFPAKKVTINLAPADLPKDSPGLDLPIAISVLALSSQLQHPSLSKALFAGELSLDGGIRPIKGIINIVEIARDQNFTKAIIPTANLPQASLVPGIKVIGVSSLIELFLQLHGQNSSILLNTKNNDFHNFITQRPLTPIVKITCSDNDPYSRNHHNEFINPPSSKTTSAQTPRSSTVVKNTDIGVTPHYPPTIVKKTNIDKHIVVKNNQTSFIDHTYPLLDHIYGQELAKRALTIAVAGHHNILFSGPPGAGKTLLAQVARNLLPDPTPEEILEITKVYSLLDSNFYNIKTRPFRSPHHTASPSSIIGGGSQALPGEITLAHKGILFLDELPEFSRNVIEALRQPLESRQVTITRTGNRSTYPADFMLIATMNPCPCGHLSDPRQSCTCTPQQISLYQKKLSGPILDRFDLIIHVKPVKSTDLLPPSGKTVAKNTKSSKQPSPPLQHSVVKNNISEAINRQFTRYHSPGHFNSLLTPSEIETLTSPVHQLLEAAIEKLHLSARSYFKILKVARTIADLDDSPVINISHLSEALSYRS